MTLALFNTCPISLWAFQCHQVAQDVHCSSADVLYPMYVMHSPFSQYLQMTKFHAMMNVCGSFTNQRIFALVVSGVYSMTLGVSAEDACISIVTMSLMDDME